MKRWQKIVLGTLGALVVVVVVFVVWVWTTALSRLAFPDTPSPSIVASTDPAVIARGHDLVYGAAHCVSCHGDYEREHPEALRTGDVPLTGGLPIAVDLGPFYAANITSDPETGIGAWSDAEIARVIRTGVRRNGDLSVFMRLSLGPVSDEDLLAIVSYLRTVAPVRHAVPTSTPGFIARALVRFATLEPRPVDVDVEFVPEGEVSVERGRYLANGPAACVGCHTPVSPDDPLGLWEGHEFSGGDAMPSEVDSSFEFQPPNLTPDPTTGLAGIWTEEQFVTRLRSGERAYTDSIMAWECFARMPETDVRSIWAYLRSLPPIHRATGPSRREAGSFTPPE